MRQNERHTGVPDGKVQIRDHVAHGQSHGTVHRHVHAIHVVHCDRSSSTVEKENGETLVVVHGCRKREDDLMAIRLCSSAVMFYYISFLRPPPAQASLAHTDQILITPQICNDLRTEYCQDTTDLYFSWALLPDQTHPVITKPTKLTSWRSTNAYKEIAVPRPQNLRDGQSWQLILSAGTSRKDQLIPLYDKDIGHTPFPVTSMPVLFTSRPRKAAKQEQIVRSYLLRAPTQEAPAETFSVREQTSFDLDKVRCISSCNCGATADFAQLRKCGIAASD